MNIKTSVPVGPVHIVLLLAIQYTLSKLTR